MLSCLVLLELGEGGRKGRIRGGISPSVELQADHFSTDLYILLRAVLRTEKRLRENDHILQRQNVCVCVCV